MADIAGSVLQGYSFGRGVALDEQDRAAAKAQSAREGDRKARLSGLLSAYAGGNQGVLGDIAGMGKEGLDAASTIGKLQEARLAQSKDQMKLSWEMLRGMPESEQPKAAQSFIAHAVQTNNLTKEQADKLSYAAEADYSAIAGAMDNYMGIKPKTAPTGGMQTVVMPDGSQQAFDITNPKQREDYRIAISAGGKAPVTRQETGSAGDFNLTKKQGEELVEAEIGTRQAIASANDILKKMDASPEAFQQVGSMASFVSGMASEVAGIAKASGLEIPVDVMDITAYENDFTKLGVESDVAKGAMFDLALSYAAASGLGQGRALSDKDVRNAMKRIGAGGVSTPAGRRAMIEDVRDVLDRKFKIRYKTLTKKDFADDLGIAEAVKATENVKAAQKYPEGTKATQGGVEYIYQNGSWVPL